jgi:hypothetical protein
MLKLAYAHSPNALAPSAHNFAFREAIPSKSIRTSKITPVASRPNELVKPLSGQYKAKNIMLLLAVSVVGLAYALLLPIAGLITLAWVAGGAYLPSSQLGKCRLMWAKHSHYFRPRLSA